MDLRSLLEMGASTSHDFNDIELEIKAKSMLVEEETEIQVGSETACNKQKSFSIIAEIESWELF